MPSPWATAATINRRLSTLRRLVKLARRLGLIDWAVDVEGLRTEPYRDTAEPGADGWRRRRPPATARRCGEVVAPEEDTGTQAARCLFITTDPNLTTDLNLECQMGNSPPTRRPQR